MSEDNNSKRFHVPYGWRVRYDYHVKPRGVSAILLDERGAVRSVGFAKFNPHDASFNAATGRSIALGRALAKLPRRLTRHEDPPSRKLTNQQIVDALAGLRDPSRSATL